MNRGPLSEVIVLGTPCKQTIWEIYNSAYVLVGYLVFTGMKWAVLVSRSTITHMESYPFCVRGKPTMESMWRSPHFHKGIANGCSCPADLRWSALTRWQTSHSVVYLAISPFIRVYQDLCL